MDRKRKMVGIDLNDEWTRDRSDHDQKDKRMIAPCCEPTPWELPMRCWLPGVAPRGDLHLPGPLAAIPSGVALVQRLCLDRSTAGRSSACEGGATCQQGKVDLRRGGRFARATVMAGCHGWHG